MAAAFAALRVVSVFVATIEVLENPCKAAQLVGLIGCIFLRGGYCERTWRLFEPFWSQLMVPCVALPEALDERKMMAQK
jgi:hypothetical protein